MYLGHNFSNFCTKINNNGVIEKVQFGYDDSKNGNVECRLQLMDFSEKDTIWRIYTNAII